MTETISPSDWTMQWDDEHTFPFVEDENANITGLGHQDRAEFARQVNLYDEVANGEPYPEDEQWTADSIAHCWAVLGDDGERLFSSLLVTSRSPEVNRLTVETWRAPVTSETPGAVPITTLWGAR